MKITKWLVFIIKVVSIVLPIIGHTIKSIKDEYAKLKAGE